MSKGSYANVSLVPSCWCWCFFLSMKEKQRKRINLGKMGRWFGVKCGVGRVSFLTSEFYYCQSNGCGLECLLAVR